MAFPNKHSTYKLLDKCRFHEVTFLINIEEILHSIGVISIDCLILSRFILGKDNLHRRTVIKSQLLLKLLFKIGVNETIGIWKIPYHFVCSSSHIQHGAISCLAQFVPLIGIISMICFIINKQINIDRQIQSLTLTLNSGPQNKLLLYHIFYNLRSDRIPLNTFICLSSNLPDSSNLQYKGFNHIVCHIDIFIEPKFGILYSRISCFIVVTTSTRNSMSFNHQRALSLSPSKPSGFVFLTNVVDVHNKRLFNR